MPRAPRPAAAFGGRYDITPSGNRSARRVGLAGRAGIALSLVGATVVAIPALTPPTPASAQMGANAVASYGDAVALGSRGGSGAPTVGLAATPTGRGYWLAAADGGVFAYGDADYFGSAAGAGLNQPIVGLAATPTGRGYWLVGRDGGIFAYGDARYFGSTAGQSLNEPITGLAATPTGRGYLLVARDGGVFAFGDAAYHGALTDTEQTAPAVAIAASPTGRGYWITAKDGGVFAFGDAEFFGSPAQSAQGPTIVAMTATRSGKGYWLAAADGGVFAYGDATFRGSMGTDPPSAPVSAIASTGDGQGYWVATGQSAFRAVDLGLFGATCYTLRGRTASGTQAGSGEIAVDPRVIPLGTHVFVDGVGLRTAEDTGGAITGNRIDVWLASSADCANFGHRTVRVWELP